VTAGIGDHWKTLEDTTMMATSHPNHDLISSNDVEGSAVYDAAGKRLGAVDHLMIGKASGLITHVVLSSGGVWGMGCHHFPLPWEALRYDASIIGFRANTQGQYLLDPPQLSGDAEAGQDGERRIQSPSNSTAYWGT
jgi:hypothetical protein